MHGFRKEYIKNQLLPCLEFSALAGFLSALIITAFKYAAETVFKISGRIYSFVSENPVWLPLLLLGTGLIGFISSLIINRFDACRGGGIPTSVAAIKGLTGFKWILSIVLLPFSALLSFFAGVPLGTEGPCVQMGTAVGDGVVRIFGAKRFLAWRRYVMSGGASAGFALATGAPISAILFSMEELNKRFSPLLLTVASVSVATSQVTMKLFSLFGIGSVSLFHIGSLPSLPLDKIYAPIILGLLSGISATLFTFGYHKVDGLMRKTLGKISAKIKLPAIFILTAVIGFFLTDTLWSGHSLIDSLFETKTAWYLLIITLLTRAVLMMSANTSGVTGGIFLPTLAFGALIGALTADGRIALNLIGAEHKALMTVLGMAAFLGSTSRIPITACVFAAEALGGINNVTYTVIAVTIALLTVEVSGLEDFTDTVIGAKLKAIHGDNKPTAVEATLTVAKGAFVIGKETADILWPAECVVISRDNADGSKDTPIIREGDLIRIRYKSFDTEQTDEELELLVGNRPTERKTK